MKNRGETVEEAEMVLGFIQEGELAQRKLYEAVLKLHSDGVTSDRLAHLLGVSRATFYRLMLEMGAPSGSKAGSRRTAREMIAAAGEPQEMAEGTGPDDV